MLSIFVAILAISPIVSEAAPAHVRRARCSGRKGGGGTRTVTEIVTGIGPPAVEPTEVVPTESISSIPSVTPTPTASISSSSPSEIATEPAFTSSTLESVQEPTVLPSVVPTSIVESGSVPNPTEVIPPFSTAEPIQESTVLPSVIPTSVEETETVPTPTSDALFAEATEVAYEKSSSEHCGTEDRLLLPGMPWTVSNAMYNSEDMVGTQCTNFGGILEAADGTQLVEWTSITDIQQVESTEDLCKGYSNIGVGVNLEERLSDVASIPAYFQWSRSNTTEFKGANVFDFITAPTQGDSQSTATSEFMLWLQIWGGQVPIAFAEGPVATLDMYGTTWRLYEGENPSSGVTVRSMLPDTEFDGEFNGDLKIWLDAMVEHGYISASEFVNVGNAGAEVFYGNSVMDARVALDIEV